jgi:hypothetical protein
MADTESGLKDSGKRIESPTGGLREPKPERFDLMPLMALYREARHFAAGAKKYKPRNWEKGIYFSTNINAIIRHTLKYVLSGGEDEDHLAAIRWNAGTLMQWEITHPELNDLAWGNCPEYKMSPEDIQKIKAWLEEMERQA